MQEFFEKKTEEKPKWSVVQTDYFFYVQACFFVVPGADMEVVEKLTAGKFPKKDEDGINCTTDPNRRIFQKTIRDHQKRGHSVNGKHPKGGDTYQLKVVMPQALKGSENDFGTPTDDSAEKEIGKIFFHRFLLFMEQGFKVRIVFPGS